MKVYVHGYKPKAKNLEERHLEGRTEHEVFYSKDPTWRMALAYEAESECIVLHSMSVHVGEHVCKFTVEELPEGDYAVVCLTHPER